MVPTPLLLGTERMIISSRINRAPYGYADAGYAHRQYRLPREQPGWRHRTTPPRAYTRCVMTGGDFHRPATPAHGDRRTTATRPATTTASTSPAFRAATIKVNTTPRSTPPSSRSRSRCSLPEFEPRPPPCRLRDDASTPGCPHRTAPRRTHGPPHLHYDRRPVPTQGLANLQQHCSPAPVAPCACRPRHISS